MQTPQPSHSSQYRCDSVHPSTKQADDMICVTLQRPPHFWRFACSQSNSAELLEQLAEMADNPEIDLTWNDAELIASEIVMHHHDDSASASQPNDR